MVNNGSENQRADTAALAHIILAGFMGGSTWQLVSKQIFSERLLCMLNRNRFFASDEFEKPQPFFRPVRVAPG